MPPTEAALIAQVSSIAAMDAFKSASLPLDDMADYNLAILAMLKAIEEKTSATSTTYAAAALGRRNSATSLSVVSPQQRIVTKTFSRPATAPTYVSGQVIGDVANAANSQLTLTNLFGQAIANTSVVIRKISLLRTVTAGTLAAANYRILAGNNGTFASALDTAVLAPSPASATSIQFQQSINMTAVAANIQYGEILLDSPMISAGAIADGFAAIINLGSVVSLASESFTLNFFIED